MPPSPSQPNRRRLLAWSAYWSDRTRIRRRHDAIGSELRVLRARLDAIRPDLQSWRRVQHDDRLRELLGHYDEAAAALDSVDARLAAVRLAAERARGEARAAFAVLERGGALRPPLPPPTGVNGAPRVGDARPGLAVDDADGDDGPDEEQRLLVDCARRRVELAEQRADAARAALRVATADRDLAERLTSLRDERAGLDAGAVDVESAFVREALETVARRRARLDGQIALLAAQHAQQGEARDELDAAQAELEDARRAWSAQRGAARGEGAQGDREPAAVPDRDAAGGSARPGAWLRAVADGERRRRSIAAALDRARERVATARRECAAAADAEARCRVERDVLCRSVRELREAVDRRRRKRDLSWAELRHGAGVAAEHVERLTRAREEIRATRRSLKAERRRLRELLADFDGDLPPLTSREIARLLPPWSKASP